MTARFRKSRIEPIELVKIGNLHQLLARSLLITHRNHFDEPR